MAGESEDRGELRAYERQLAALVALTRSGLGLATHDEAAALREITETAARVLDVARVGLWLDDAGAAIVCRDLYEAGPGEHSVGQRLEARDYPAYFLALADNDVIPADDARVDPRTREFTESYLEPLQIGAMLDAPVVVSGAFAGVLCCEHVGGPRRWTYAEQAFAVSVANLAALVLSHGARVRSERRLHAIVETEPECVKVVSAEGRVLQMNPAGLRMVEADEAEDVVGSRVVALVHPEDRAAFGALHERASAGESGKLRFRLVGLRGTTRWVETHSTPLPERDDAPASVLSVTRDVTERVEAEALLADSEERFRQLADHIHEVFYSYDVVHERLLYVNPAFEQIWGRTLESAYAEPLSYFDAVHADDRAAAEGAYHRQLAGEETNVDFRVIRPDGTARWVSEHAVPVLADDGAVSRIVGTIRDVTDVKRHEFMRAWESRVLEAISRGEALKDILTRIVSGAEAFLDDAVGSIMRVTTDGRHLRHGAAPGLPAAFNLAVDGIAVGPGVGSCGTAVFLREPVIVTDIAIDPLWTDHRELALTHGLRACWSQPVIDSAGVVRGVFGLYYRQPRAPTPRELGLIERTARVASIAFERDRHVEELRASEDLFRRTLQDAATGIAVTDLAGRYLEVNTAYCRMVGYTADELRAMRFPTLTHPDDRARSVALLDELLAGGRASYVIEKRYVAKGGRTVWVRMSVSAQRDAHGDPLRVISVAEDITAQREAAARLIEQAALLDAAREAILVTDLEDRVIYWNKGAERTFGWTAEEAVGRLGRELMVTDEGGYDEAFAGLARDGEWQGELNKRHRDGRELIVEARCTRILDADGRPKSVLSINADITERVRLERQFLRAQRLESIGTLAGGIAHDLNNVLAPILMSIGLLRLEAADDRHLDVLETIEASAQRGADLVRQILGFARGIEGRREPVYVRELVRDVEKVARDTFPKHIEFVISAPDASWVVTGDATQLHQLVLNLCLNARDAMPRGGVLRIEVGNEVLDEIYSDMNARSKAGPHVVVTVEDTGIGIPSDDLDKVFDPFFTTKPLGQGTGLGLPTVLTIARSHGGFVDLDSEPGRGTRVRVYLPADPSSSTVPPPVDPRAEPPDGRGEQILVVDDEEAIRKVVRRTLERHGYRVLLAANGAEAVALFAQHRRDVALVLTDMAMPIMDGPATVAALRAIDPEIPIIGASGLAASEMIAKASAVGLAHFVPKPFTAEALLALFDEVLRGERS